MEAATWDGYSVQVSDGLVRIMRIDNATQTFLITITQAIFASGDKLGMRIVGTTIQAWKQASGSSSWSAVVSVTDATYGSAGKIGLRTGDNTVRMDDFYAGPNEYFFGGSNQQVPAVPFR